MLMRHAAIQTTPPIRVQDFFSQIAYAGTGGSLQIHNNLNLTSNHGLVWIKGRNFGGSLREHYLFDTLRGSSSYLVSNSTNYATTYVGTTCTFTSSGVYLGVQGTINGTAELYSSWSFRKAPKFFDVVSYTGNGVNGRQILHNLEIVPGMIIVKQISAIQDWYVWNRTTGNDYWFYFNRDSMRHQSGIWVSNPSSTYFSVGDVFANNGLGETYIAYLFAHDPTGIIQCSSFTTDASGNGSISHGWSSGVQYMMLKCATTTGDWEIYDTARTSAFSGNDARLRANLNNVEDSVARVSASGTTLSLTGLSASQTYIYMIIKAA